jgi:hypothetical protein
LTGYYQWGTMCNVLTFISIVISLLLAGCFHTEFLGQKRVSVGTVVVSTSLDFMGDKFINKIVVATDENGNAIVSAQDSEAIIIKLTPSAQKEVIKMLNKSVKWGSIDDKEKADVQKPLGHLRTKVGKYGWPTDLVMQFYASKAGKIWNVSFELCDITPEAFRNGPEVKAAPCEKKMTLFLTEFSAKQLINCLSLTSNYAQKLNVPGAPTNVTATAGNAQAKVSFSEPSSNGASAITGYTVTTNPPAGIDINAGSTLLAHTITGLTNGTAYTFSVQTRNAAGTGTASSPSNSVTPADVPGAPTNVTATAGNAQAKVSFSEPSSNGGSAITGYTVTTNPPAGTDVNAGSTLLAHTITGLTNGTAYTFSVQARNAAQTGPSSSPSNSVTPLDVPGAPTKVTATAGNAQAKVSFSEPGSNGGSAITGYTVTSNPPAGTDINAGSTASTHTITGLINSTAYTFSVQATNAAGTGPASSPSNSVTPLDVPGVPTNVTATAGNAKAKVSFSAPASNGASAITGYTVTSNPPAGTDVNDGSTLLAHTITGLTAGTAYTFSVQASNAAGTGFASSPSNSVTPFTVPGAPTMVTATAGNAQAKVSFSEPSSNGGSAITGYTVTSNPPAGIDINAGSTLLAHTINDLTNGTAYTFSVQATNAAGTGPASSPSNSVTPFTQ